MKHYIRNIKQCFTDKNVRITKVKHYRYLNYDYVKINVQTFNYIPDTKNINSFDCSKNYFNHLRKNYYPYHGLPEYLLLRNY